MLSTGINRLDETPPASKLSIDLNHIANNQFAASSGFHLTVNLNFTTLNQQLRLSA